MLRRRLMRGQVILAELTLIHPRVTERTERRIFTRRGPASRIRRRYPDIPRSCYWRNWDELSTGTDN